MIKSSARARRKNNKKSEVAETPASKRKLAEDKTNIKQPKNKKSDKSNKSTENNPETPACTQNALANTPAKHKGGVVSIMAINNKKTNLNLPYQNNHFMLKAMHFMLT